ncbi:TPA: IS6 family transposase, partial [Enterococcus faecium]|nr:IS6 family transposase [Enterococcus faecium]
MDHFKGKQFQKDVIIVAVGYYLRYNLSYRDVQEILYDRGINVSHTTIYRWVQEYGKLLYTIWKKKNWNGNSFFDKFYKVQNFFPYA